MSKKVGRNERCPCGSGKKFKHCHGRQSGTPLPAAAVRLEPRRAVLDWMAGFLEEHVSPKFESLRGDFQHAYLKVMEAWAVDPIHDLAVFDTEKCRHMLEIAESHLHVIANVYHRRFLINAVRTLPLSVVAYITMQFWSDDVVSLVRSATLAAWLFGKPTPAESFLITSGRNAIQASREDVEYAKKHIGRDLARLIGATFARQTAEGAYRMAGKGATLKKPDPVPPEVWKLFDSYRPGQILLVPHPTFEPDEALEKSVREYDRRRKEQGNLDASGLLVRPPDFPGEAGNGWWTTKAPRDILGAEPMEVYYPTLDMTVITKAYFVHPVDSSRALEQLKSFSDEFPGRLGFDFRTFEILCRTIYRLIQYETGYWELDNFPSPVLPSRLRSKLKADDPRAVQKGAPNFLYSLFARAAIRGPRESFLSKMAIELTAEGVPEPRAVAERFVERFCFSTQSGMDESLSPLLFLATDDVTLMVDVLLMATFFELCLRVLTSGSGGIGNLRSSLFEQAARSRITSGLALTPGMIPFRPNRDLVVEDRNYGDVDFCFVTGDCLVNMDMKSWQRSPAYFRGDFKTIDNRQIELTQQMGKVEIRGAKLLEEVNKARSTSLSGVLNFLCVANVEYVSPRYSGLWYGETPRVLTPDELVALFQNEKQLRLMLRSAGFT